MGAILALLAGLSLFTPPPARAHSCGLPARFDVGKAGNLTIGVAAEAKPITAFDVDIPTGFRIDSLVPTAGWTGSKTDKQLHYQGGPIGLFACAFFTVTGETSKKGVYAFEITTHAQDGTALHYTSRDPSDLYAAQLVLAGVEPDSLIPGSSGTSNNEGGAGRGWVAPAGAAVLGAGAATAITLSVRRRRRRARPRPRPRPSPRRR
jgi:hypothetical protein